MKLYTEQQRKGEMQWVENLKPADEYTLLCRAYNEHFSVYGELLDVSCIRTLVLTAFAGDEKLKHDLYAAFETSSEETANMLLERHVSVINELCEVLDNIVDILNVAEQYEQGSPERCSHIYSYAQDLNIPLSHWDAVTLATFDVASLK